MNARQKAELQKITQRALKNVGLSTGTLNEEAPKAFGKLETLQDVPVQVSVGLGKTTLMMGDLMALKKGDVLTLDKQAGDPVDVFVNNHLVAHGELTLSGEQFGVILTEIISA